VHYGHTYIAVTSTCSAAETDGSAALTVPLLAIANRGTSETNVCCTPCCGAVRTNGAGHVNYKSKAIPVTGRGDLQGCEMLRLPHFVDNQLTDGGEVVSHMCMCRLHPPPPRP
jgi:hypothetical protein